MIPAAKHGVFQALAPLSYDRAALTEPRQTMSRLWRAIFTTQRAGALDAAASLARIAKTADVEGQETLQEQDSSDAGDDPSADRDRIFFIVAAILAAIDFGISATQAAQLRRALAEAAQDASRRACAQLLGMVSAGASEGAAPGTDVLGGDIFDKLNVRAEDWAAEHMAALLKEAAETTREALRAAIADRLADGQSFAQIIETIGNLGAFSDARAALIAKTEIAAADSMGALAGLFQARETGIVVKKAWLTARGLERICVVCLANAAEGELELEAKFSSGDDAPPAHPNCRCRLVAWVQDIGATKMMTHRPKFEVSSAKTNAKANAQKVDLEPVGEFRSKFENRFGKSAVEREFHAAMAKLKFPLLGKASTRTFADIAAEQRDNRRAATALGAMLTQVGCALDRLEGQLEREALAKVNTHSAIN